MVVTSINEINKSKCVVCIDNEKTFALYKNELRRYAIEESCQISKEVYDMIYNEILMKRARLRSMNLLQSRDYTRAQILNKLKQGYYPDEIISETINYLVSYRYLDDIRYCKYYISYASQSKSNKQIKNDLARKGVDKADIEKAFWECEQIGDVQNEEVLIKKCLEKKRYDSESATFDETQKVIAFLFRKGFSLDKIYKVVGEKMEEY